MAKMNDAVTEQIAQVVQALVQLRELGRAKMNDAQSMSTEKICELASILNTVRLDIDGYESTLRGWRKAV